MRIIVVFLAFVSMGFSSSSLSLWNILDVSASMAFGNRYDMQKKELLQDSSFMQFLNELGGGKKQYVGQNKNVVIHVPDGDKLFNYLLEAETHTGSVLPAHYAFTLVHLTSQYRDPVFINRYGKAFAAQLANSRLCAGLFWKGEIASLSPAKEDWKKGLSFYREAIGACKDNSHLSHKAKLQIAKLKYLIGKKEKADK